jgi:hypothetical protein
MIYSSTVQMPQFAGHSERSIMFLNDKRKIAHIISPCLRLKKGLKVVDIQQPLQPRIIAKEENVN